MKIKKISKKYGLDCAEFEKYLKEYMCAPDVADLGDYDLENARVVDVVNDYKNYWHSKQKQLLAHHNQPAAMGNSSTQLSKLRKAYNKFPRQTTSVIFPQGIQQAFSILKTLSMIYDADLDLCSVDDCHTILRTYSDIFLKLTIFGETHYNIERILSIKYPAYASKPQCAAMAVEFTHNIINGFPNTLTDDLIANRKTAAQLLFDNQVYDTTYGRNLHNPICAASIAAGNEYLSKLRTKQGDKIYWYRTQALEVTLHNSSINTIIDCYDLYVHGSFFEKIYLCPYSIDSSVAPSGMILKASENDEEYGGNLEIICKEKSVTLQQLLTFHKLQYEKPPFIQEIEDAKRNASSSLLTSPASKHLASPSTLESDFSSAEKLQEQKDWSDTDKLLFCRKCGSQLLSDSLFCCYCGTKVSYVTDQGERR